MKKVVLKLNLHDDKVKQKAMKKVSGLPGIESMSMDMKDQKLTVTGDIDPIIMVGKLRKICHTEIVSAGPAKDDNKKDDKKKQEEKKYYARSAEEDPNSCVNKQWVCDKCSKGYAIQSDYNAHLKTCGDSWYCDSVFYMYLRFEVGYKISNVTRVLVLANGIPTQHSLFGA